MTSNVQDDHYDQYLAKVHSQWKIPDHVIDDVVKEVLNLDVISKFRIIAGEENEVYDVTLSNTSHVVIRISDKGYPKFRQEKWAMEKVAKLGVPVPEILYIKDVDVGDRQRSVCLMKKVAGEPLEHGVIKFDSLSIQEKKDLIGQAGQILSKIHSIKIAGYGWIFGEGKVQCNNLQDLFNWFSKDRENLVKIAHKEKFDPLHIDKALKIITNSQNIYSQLQPCLNHGDYSNKHFMVRKNKIIAILDWADIRADIPVFDFANWDYWFGETILTDWLKDGYENKSLFTKDFDELLHVLRLLRGLDMINWYHGKYQQGIDQAIKKLLSDLEYFK